MKQERRNLVTVTVAALVALTIGAACVYQSGWSPAQTEQDSLVTSVALDLIIEQMRLRIARLEEKEGLDKLAFQKFQAICAMSEGYTGGACEPGTACLYAGQRGGPRDKSVFPYEEAFETATRCCSGSGSSVKCSSFEDEAEEKCFPAGLTYSESKYICEKAGKRLCTAAEGAKCKGTGCYHNMRYAWTSDSCSE